ncbi:elongation factor P-like protein YeiP, partial [bacterium]|nr:elongation factor P-like protein YeiP [bacterium]
YLYREGDALTFMYVKSSAPPAMDDEQLEDSLPFCDDGMEGLTALIVEDRCVGISLPQIVELDVVETAPAMKGASQSARTKPATLSTGLEIQVPEYLAEGERVRVNTQTRSFQSRA